MSDKLSMPALDKVTTRIQVRATTWVRLEAMRDMMGLSSMNPVINAGLEQLVSNIPFGPKERARLDELMKKNESARKAAKEKKGLH